MEIAISILAKIVEYTIAPIGRQVGYLFLYNKNIEHLRARNEELVDVVKELGHRVDEAKSNGCEIEPRVSTWFETANKSIAELSNVFQEIESGSNEKCSITCCFGLSKRYQLSRKANKKGKECSELITIGENFERVGYLVPLSGTSGSFNIPEDYQFLESRTSMVKQIKDALANPDPIFNRIGLFGMGGVGKTMLLHEVEKLVLEDKLFDQVIKVIIGQSIDVKDIQAQLGEKLRMNLVELTESKQGRADLLRKKLQVENKILVMLDDLWNKLDLQDVGIPCRSKLSEKGSKILITSRQRNVLTKDMDIETCFELNHLSEEESWKVFSAIVGKFDGVDYIKNVAEKVAKQCKGLPLALTVVANTLKKEERLEIWKDTLNQLENPTAPEIGGVTDELYSAIKWSYDHIKSTETRSLFLLCSVFPDDYQISVENLQMYAMGMRLLSGVKTWDETRNRVTKLVDDLISSSLLLKSNWGDKYVIMHDVVRDVAIHIASEANMSALNFGYKHSEWAEEDRRGPFKAIFGGLANFHCLPQDLEFQNLKLLILYGENSNREELQISNTFFEGMKKLTVLDLSNMWLQEPLTHALAENLQIFCMRECKVDNIDIIGKLKKLQVLRIKYCRITHLPATMSELTELKVLEVSDCKDLNVIPQKIFSGMKKLEELDLLESFKSWGEEVSYKNVLMKNVTLEELKCLPRLMSLKLDILDERMLKDLSLPENFNKFGNFCFHVGDKHTFSREYYFERVAPWCLRLDQKLI